MSLKSSQVQILHGQVGSSKKNEKRNKFCLFEKSVWFGRKRPDTKELFDSNPITLIASVCWKFLERKDDMESSLLAWSISIPPFHILLLFVSLRFFLLLSLLESFCYRCNVFFLITFALFFSSCLQLCIVPFSFICLFSFLFLFLFNFNSFVCNKFACFKQQEIHPRSGRPSRQTPSVIHQHFVKIKTKIICFEKNFLA